MKKLPLEKNTLVATLEKVKVAFTRAAAITKKLDDMNNKYEEQHSILKQNVGSASIE